MGVLSEIISEYLLNIPVVFIGLYAILQAAGYCRTIYGIGKAIPDILPFVDLYHGHFLFMSPVIENVKAVMLKAVSFNEFRSPGIVGFRRFLPNACPITAGYFIGEAGP